MSPGSTVQAFPKCFCALPGITQLHCMGFLFREIPEVALTHEFLSDLWRLHCSHTAKQSCLFCTYNNLFLLQSASFLSLCGYSILTSQSKLNAVWVLLRSPVVQCLSRVMTARLCQGHCNVFYSVLAWASFRQHNFCSEMKYKNNVANRMIIKKKKAFIQVKVHILWHRWTALSVLFCALCTPCNTFNLPFFGWSYHTTGSASGLSPSGL